MVLHGARDETKLLGVRKLVVVVKSVVKSVARRCFGKDYVQSVILHRYQFFIEILMLSCSLHLRILLNNTQVAGSREYFKASAVHILIVFPNKLYVLQINFF